MRRWIFVAAALLAAVLVFASLRERPPSDADEIDEASKQALREILQQEDE